MILWFACHAPAPPPAPAPEVVSEPAPPPPPPLPLAEAVALGDCTSVLRHEAGEQPAAPLAYAWCWLRTGTPERVLADLPVAPDDPLAGYRRLLRARAAAATQGDVLSELQGLTLPGAAGREVSLLRGRTRAEAGDPAARADLEPLLSTEAGPEARFWLATLAGRSGDPVAERARLLEAWLDARPGGWDGRAAERLAALGSAVPDLQTADGRATARERLAALAERNRAAEALTLAEALAAREPPSDRASLVQLGRVRYNARDYPGALNAWRGAFGAPPEARGSASELFDYALCHARTGDYDTAGVVYERVWKQYPSAKEADFASYKIGYMKWDRADCAVAADAFAAHRKRYPESRYLDEQLWFSARCAWKAGDVDGARAAWDELERRRPSSSLVAGAAYWRARALARAGDLAGEAAGYERVLAEFPTTAYAWFAAERLGRTSAAPVPAPFVAPAVPQPAGALLAVGLAEWARDEIGALPAPTSDDEKLARAAAFAAAGDYLRAKALACPLARGPGPAEALCTPRPAPDIVERYAKEIDPSLVYGVMVAESALDPSVSSAVGARGLMQLMPEVGAGIHARLFPDRRYDADDLFSAPYNVALGTTELSDRAGSLAGFLVPSPAPAVVASYNAGEDAVRRWNLTTDFDEWTEDIGFVETRGYVKRVLANAMGYRRIYGDHR